ncbi:hypothetical protein DICPUDRAFT_157748 [Dictyostelium purpureum]|uniref:Uncharacterized protein n=1 Tax=Dictyostelium purpureum TaxID=5786 RepID=F0ZZW5_DICPU|nr:uncharacterized protein DICPUDRAFT_157748 [Dictyostelium purpureum]EGC30515.1 hypothetical protein DICPUDRAFT_157748 [Dictyostelium purpureum]|eukprot:XP_003292963.1 hypothetical protein DICPUDRAFT_157748 [Dictyostelium purpureum]
MNSLCLELLNRVEKLQYINTNRKKNGFYYEEKGFFSMDIHFNFTGNEIMTEARKKLKVPDGNGFTTNFIIYCLLESKKINSSINLNKKVVKRAFKAMSKCYDNNSCDGKYGFWIQKHDNENNIFVQSPVNYQLLVNESAHFTDESLTKLFGIKKRNEFNSTFSYSSKKCLSIPSDNDSTSINYALGSSIFDLRNEFPDSYQYWQSKNNDLQNYFQIISKYSYRPFSSNTDENSIDPRTYYFVRGFIKEWLESGRKKEDLILPMVYAMNQTEQLNVFPHIQIPSLSNHIDISILANVLFAIISSIKCKPHMKITNDINNILISIVLLIEYVLKTKLLFKRADLTVFYYPSLYPVFWFISRSLNTLKDFKLNSNSFPKSLKTVLQNLNNICKSYITKFLLKKVKRSANECYWEDFLGNGDSLDGKPVNYSEDRFFSTSCAINILIDTWSTPMHKGSNQIKWKENLPSEIKKLVDSSYSYLIENILKNKDMDNNIFFSSHTKGKATTITNYPSNITIDVTTGAHHSESNADELLSKKILVALVRGVIDENEYNKMLDESKIQWNDVYMSLFTGEI